MNVSKVNRVEVIDENGRSYVKYNCKDVKMSLQDEGYTLKLFLDKERKMRESLLHAAMMHAQAHVEKHRMNIEVYLTNPAGIGEHSDIMEAIETELEEMAKYEDHMEILEKYFPI